jgi:tetratricopeptide (TPR) repeat protein
LRGITRAGFESDASNRPVANISFALNYYFHQYNVMGYHLVNILIHITAGILIYLFTKITLNTPTLRSMYTTDRWIPFFTAFLWLVHPIQTQSVSYIVQRMNSMAAMFYILSLLLYTKGRLAGGKGKRWVLFTGCAFAGILALGSKETAATLPFFIFLYEWYFFQDSSLTWLKRHFLGLTMLILLVLLAFVYLGAHPLESILYSYQGRDFTWTQRVLTEFRVVLFYISLLIFPHPSRLNLDHDFTLSHSLFEPTTTLLSIVAIAGLIGLSFYVAKKQRLLSFCILWFLGNLVIESSVIGLEIIFEHRIYLPSMLIILMAVMLAYRYARPKWLRVAVICLLITMCCVWTYERNSVWSDEVALWKDCVEKSPNKARPHNNLGLVLAQQGKLKEAMGYYSKALKIKPGDVEVLNNLGLALAGQGRLEEAISHYSKALEIEPNFVGPHYNLGLALAEQGDLEEAISHFSRATKINPDFAEAYNNIGVAREEQGKLGEAISHYSKALKIKPDDVEALNNLGAALARQGDLEEAISHFSRAVRINPDSAISRHNLNFALRQAGKYNKGESLESHLK